MECIRTRFKSLPVENMREVEQKRFLATHVNRKLGLVLFCMPWRIALRLPTLYCKSVSVFTLLTGATCRNIWAKPVNKNSKKSTLGWRVLIKNVFAWADRNADPHCWVALEPDAGACGFNKDISSFLFQFACVTFRGETSTEMDIKNYQCFCQKRNGSSFPCSLFLWPIEMTSTTKCTKLYFHWSFEHSGVLSVVGYKSTDLQTMGNSCRYVNHENTFSNYHSLK